MNSLRDDFNTNIEVSDKALQSAHGVLKLYFQQLKRQLKDIGNYTTQPPYNHDYQMAVQDAYCETYKNFQKRLDFNTFVASDRFEIFTFTDPYYTRNNPQIVIYDRHCGFLTEYRG